MTRHTGPTRSETATSPTHSSTHPVNANAATAATPRTTRESTKLVTAAGSGRVGLSGSNRGRFHARATRAKVKVNAHAAPITENVYGTGRSLDPPRPCAT